MRQSRQLFFTFFSLGLMTFGGGIAMLPYIKRQAINRKWIQPEEWNEILTLSQLAPGAIAVNCANLIGYRVGKIRGSILAIMGMILPPIFIMLALALGLQPLLNLPWVVKALQGMYLVVVILFARALLNLGQSAWQKLWYLPMTALSFALTFGLKIPPVFVMIVATMFSLLLTWYRGKIR